MRGPIHFDFFSRVGVGGGRVVDVSHRGSHGLPSRINWTQRGSVPDRNINIMRQSVCLVVNPNSVDSYGVLFNSTTVGPASDLMTALT